MSHVTKLLWKVSATMLLHLWYPLIWYVYMTMSEKGDFWPLDPNDRMEGGVCGQNICCHVSAYVIPFNLICNIAMVWKSWILIPPQGQGSLLTKYLLQCCYMCDSLWFDMQYDHVLKKLNFDLLTSPPVFRSGGGWVESSGKIFATMFLHSWFPFIWYANSTRLH